MDAGSPFPPLSPCPQGRVRGAGSRGRSSGSGAGSPAGVWGRRPSPAPAAGAGEADARSEPLTGSDICHKAFLHSSLRSCHLLTVKMGKELYKALVSLIW